MCKNAPLIAYHSNRFCNSYITHGQSISHTVYINHARFLKLDFTISDMIIKTTSSSLFSHRNNHNYDRLATMISHTQTGIKKSSRPNKPLALFWCTYNSLHPRWLANKLMTSENSHFWCQCGISICALINLVPTSASWLNGISIYKPT